MRRFSALVVLVLCLCHPVPLGVDHIVSVTRMVEPSREDAPERVIEAAVTWYTNDDCHSRSSPMYGLTASGARAGEDTAASDTLPFGTVIWIPWVGFRVIQDRGVGAQGIDVWCPSEKTAIENGRQRLEVRIEP